MTVLYNILHHHPISGYIIFHSLFSMTNCSSNSKKKKRPQRIACVASARDSRDAKTPRPEGSPEWIALAKQTSSAHKVTQTQQESIEEASIRPQPAVPLAATSPVHADREAIDSMVTGSPIVAINLGSKFDQQQAGLSKHKKKIGKVEGVHLKEDSMFAWLRSSSVDRVKSDIKKGVQGKIDARQVQRQAYHFFQKKNNKTKLKVTPGRSARIAALQHAGTSVTPSPDSGVGSDEPAMSNLESHVKTHSFNVEAACKVAPQVD